VQDVLDKDHFYIVEQKRKTKQRNKKYTVRKRIPLIKKLQRLISSYCEGMRGTEYLFNSRQGKNRPITRVRLFLCKANDLNK